MKKLYLIIFLTLNIFSVNAENNISNDSNSISNETSDGFNDGFEDDFNDTDDIFANVDSQKTINSSNSSNSLYGSIDFELVHNYNNNAKLKNLSSSKILLDLIYHKKLADYKIYANLKGYKDFIYQTNLGNYSTKPRGYESEINLNEFFISGKINAKLDYKIGRQIVVLGKSDNIRITDLINPLDNRLLGIVDIKNLRLGRFISKFDYYGKSFKLSASILHENIFSKNPQFGSDFKLGIDLAENKPSSSFKNTGIALNYSTSINGYDLEVSFINTYLDKPYIKNNILQFDDKVKTFGLALNKVVDSYLFKAEIVYLDKIKYNGITDEKSRVDSLIGVEYNSVSYGNISYELALRKISNFDNGIDSVINAWTKKNTYQHALRFTQSYKNQTIELTTLLSLFGANANQGGFARMAVNYKINDLMAINTGIINYIGGSYKNNIKQNNDRIFSKLTYKF